MAILPHCLINVVSEHEILNISKIIIIKHRSHNTYNNSLLANGKILLRVPGISHVSFET